MHKLIRFVMPFMTQIEVIIINIIHLSLVTCLIKSDPIILAYFSSAEKDVSKTLVI